MITPEPEASTSVARLYALSGILAVLTIPALALDLPIARLCADNGLPGDLRKGLNLMEAYAHGIGVGLICLTVFVLVLYSAGGFGRALTLIQDMDQLPLQRGEELVAII